MRQLFVSKINSKILNRKGDIVLFILYHVLKVSSAQTAQSLQPENSTSTMNVAPQPSSIARALNISKWLDLFDLFFTKGAN